MVDLPSSWRQVFQRRTDRIFESWKVQIHDLERTDGSVGMRISKQSHPFPAISSVHNSVWTASLILLAFVCSARAADALKLVPADSAAVLSIRNPLLADEHITTLIRKLKPEFDGLPLADLETTIGFPPGTIDLSKPVVFVFRRPDDLPRFLGSEGIGADQSQTAVIFTPKSLARFQGTGKSQRNSICDGNGVWSPFKFVVCDDLVCVAKLSKTLRPMTRVRERNSLDSQLNPVCKKLFESSDVTLHFVMSEWKEKINPATLIIANLLKLSIMSKQTPESLAQSQEIVSWFLDGGRDAIDQIQGTTLALQTDGKSVTLRHAHSFESGRWMAQYLAKVGRSGKPPLQTLPDRPFMFAGYSDWKVPPEASLTVKSTELLMKMNQDAVRLTEDQRRQLTQASKECARDLLTGDYMLCSQSNNLLPLNFYGSYAANDATGLMAAYERLQKHSGELWAGFAGGAVPSANDFEDAQVNGLRVRRIKIVADAMPEQLKQQVSLAYGPDARLEIAVLDDHHIGYSIGQPPVSVAEMKSAASTGQNLCQNPMVKHTLSLLPADANIALMVDLDSTLKNILAFSKWPGGAMGSEMPPGPLVRAASDRSEPHLPSPPAMLAWSCRVDAGALDCQFSMDGRSLAAFLKSLKSVRDRRPDIP